VWSRGQFFILGQLQDIAGVQPQATQ